MQPLVSTSAAAAAIPSPPPPALTLPPPRRRIPPPLTAGALLCNRTGSGHASPRGRRPLPPPAMSHPLSSEPHALEQRAVVVTNKHGEKLVGVLHHTGSSKIVVLCHGFISTKNDSLILDLMAALTKKGISVFRFDFSGNGESEGEFEYGNYRKEADDLHSVVSYLCKEKYDVTAIVGHSKGGDVVTLYASIYDDVRLVINVSGRFDLEKGIEERIGEGSIDRINKEGYLDVKDKSGNVQYRVTKESLMERLNTDIRAVSMSITKECRFFTVHGSADETIPVEDAYKFAKHIPNHKLQVIEGANHNYTAHREELADAVVDFITSN
ncbi:esterase/lipase/thioesterase family protein-like [Oryza sativa Japonica Group]|uniref:Esterase/lipase/thioesterase family protein-like n=3 Tax=Oryza sativa subsp. japonica TaxID=39947 RepID=Q0JLR1_ORYSJ|nr:uncharacterized protein LOC4323862 [Oryza sativa Japonica Group]KAF2950874.1 hypothetical protein DAI22_01g218900 [Oryza sativa Japonica Group]BAB32948.1 esterase/lipase/thioesterase family protein-like [Oryza sativa Japonica Group]BAB84453.1 esterase/lipase/thioesterase family protein-like [Oryza sativa Japonica Group]BAF05317.1 Os01g0580000 [Oryza sativa Japonica Group]BAS72853.1 Os01g0580000 [Oryza sativa Japonica Group]|eukprot:NP_001043403.1 Os01g0580000 [Oryza sativa Japonica Group]